MAKYIRSWAKVLPVFLGVVLFWVLWLKYTPASVKPLEPQLIDNPEPVIAKVQPSVVSLWVVRNNAKETQIGMIGCGLVVDSRGFILTSATLAPDIESLQIIDHKGNKFQAAVIITDKQTRLTLLEADPGNATASEGFEPAYLGDSEQAGKGDAVVTLGGRITPSSWELTTKTGRITKQRQTLVFQQFKYRDLIQTDVPLTSENTGGPLINLNGDVVGLGLPFVQPPGCPSSFNYAVPINQGRNLLARLPIPHWTGEPAQQVCNWLGAEMLPLNLAIGTGLSGPQRRGEIVNYIRNNSPAEHAGLRRGDVIVRVNNNKITDRSSLDNMVPQLCQANKIELSVLRGSRVKNLTVYWDKPIYTLPGTGSLEEVILVVLIFSLMYYFMYRNIFDRVFLFVLGAIVVAIVGHHVGFYNRDQIASALKSKIDVLCFIVGMQLISGLLEEAGALEYLAKKITLATAGNTWRIMLFFCLVTYTISLMVNNLTTIMLVAPMVLRLSKYLNFDPKPFLVGIIVASNLGGASTMVGDFPNMLISTEAGLPFYQFIYYMLPICLLELFVMLLYLRFAMPSLFRCETNIRSFLATWEPLKPTGANEYQDCEQWDADFQKFNGRKDKLKNSELFLKIKQSLPGAIKNRTALKRGLVIMGGVVIGFLLSDYVHCPAAVVALVGGITALVFGGCEPVRLLEKVSIRDILFFSGLFVLVGAAEASGALTYVSRLIVSLSFGNILILCLLLMWVGAFATCFLNAGPTTAMFLPVVLSFQGAAPHNLYWWALSLGVCAGSSGTLVGATAGSVTANMIDRFMKKEEHEPAVLPISTDVDSGRYTKMTFREYSALGFPIMLIFLFISSIYITVIYRF